MEIIKEFGTFYLLFWWVMCILYKDNWLQTKLDRFSRWLITKYKPCWALFGMLIYHLPLMFSVNYCGLDSLWFSTNIVVFLLLVNLGKLGKFFNKLATCKFCMESHTATVLAIGYSSYMMDYNYLYWGLMCASINGWLREFIKK